MSESPPVFLQICANDSPPFADLCRYYEAAARGLGWQPLTVMLDTRAPVQEPTFHYLSSALAPLLKRLLGGRTPRLTVCHRYRAYRSLMSSGFATEPLVLVAHEFGLLRRRQRRLRRGLDRLLGRPSVRFAGVSDVVVEDLRRFVDPVWLLPNGIDLARADAERLDAAAARRELGLDASEFNIGVVGRLHPKKNPGLAVDGFRGALSRLGREASSDLRLVFVGAGELESEIAQRAAGLPVRMQGFVAAAPRLMTAFDLLLVSSGEREAFGMVALEAMAAGVPVLCGPSPGPRFVTGDAGLHYDVDRHDAVADALVRAYRDAGSGGLAMLARKARVRVEHEFSVAAAGRRLAALAD
ncbi:MAG: glycosyltransferase family 4 protein [Pseudomonadales bacterium]